VATIAGMLDCCNERGLSLPEDVSFAEFTDSELATLHRPPLSVILRPVHEMGRHAGRMALARMANPDLPPRVEVVPTSFLDRASTAAPRAARAAAHT
jgi:DNA-binding LacI/PurR family transcriptional regulator